MPNGFIKNANRVDPYKTFKFRLSWDNKTVLGVHKVSPLKRTTNVITHRSGGDNSTDNKSPGRTTYDAVTLERGITHDVEFEAWANKVHSADGDASMDLANFRKELTLDVMNEKGQVALSYHLHRCWVSEFTAVPALDATANTIAVESIKIEVESWDRDPATKEPDEKGSVPQG
jgi:phage tail-like protein